MYWSLAMREVVFHAPVFVGDLPNILAAAASLGTAGAVYIARWTTYHVKQLERAMTELLLKKGFGFLEVGTVTLKPQPSVVLPWNAE